MARFLCTVAYEEKGHEILFEVWLENEEPEGETEREEVEGALRQITATGLAPEGWTVTALNWSHPRSGREGLDASKIAEFDGLVRRSEIKVDENPEKPPKELDEEEQ